MLACPSCGATYVQRQEHCGLDGHRLVDVGVPPLVGRTVDRYRIEETIGSGGMAIVYRAVHVHLEQSFALKALHGEMASDATIAKRFHREAKVMSQLAHPHIVSVVDFGTTDAGLLYMVMQYVRGPTLADVMRHTGPLGPARTARLARQIATGLDRAHRSGFVHRDLKPQNVMLVGGDDGDEERAQILDFGLVGLVEPEASHQTQLTTRGMFFGTPAYMSPEQISGGPVGPSSDLYALGVILYAMLVGELPFRGEVRELAHQHVTKAPPRPRLEYGGLTEVVMRLLAKAPEERPASARAVVDLIDRAFDRSSWPAVASDDDGFDDPTADATASSRGAAHEALAAEPALVVSDPAEITHADGLPVSTRRTRRGRWLVAAAGLLAVFAAAAWTTGPWPQLDSGLPGLDGEPGAGPNGSAAASEAPESEAGREAALPPSGRTDEEDGSGRPGPRARRRRAASAGPRTPAPSHERREAPRGGGATRDAGSARRDAKPDAGALGATLDASSPGDRDAERRELQPPEQPGVPEPSRDPNETLERRLDESLKKIEPASTASTSTSAR